MGDIKVKVEEPRMVELTAMSELVQAGGVDKMDAA